MESLYYCDCKNSINVCDHFNNNKNSDETYYDYPTYSFLKTKDSMKIKRYQYKCLPTCMRFLYDIKKLDICNTDLDDINILPINLIVLNIYNESISKISAIVPDSLRFIIIENTSIDCLDLKNTNIDFLNCGYTKIKTLILPKTLKTLILKLNNNLNFKNINFLETELYYLNASVSNMTEIPKLPDSVNILMLNDNNIKYVDYLPSNIKTLNLTSNSVERIRYLPDSLKKLYVSSNRLRTLPILNKDLEILTICNNPIEKLIVNGESLVEINDYNSLLSEIKFINNYNKKIENSRQNLIIRPISMIDNFKNINNIKLIKQRSASIIIQRAYRRIIKNKCDKYTIYI